MDIFEKFAALFYELSGIEIKETKKDFLISKIDKFISLNPGIKDYWEFYNLLINDKNSSLTKKFVSILTINFTFFFRDMAHFNFLKFFLINKIDENAQVRIWSAGCSTGEEPYSIAITLFESIYETDKKNIKILATDLSEAALNTAVSGKYNPDKVISYFDEKKLKNYFKYDDKQKIYQIKDFIKNLISFRHLSLMSPVYPFHNKFDIVFLRNVMIYFNDPEKEKVLNKINDVMKIGGYLVAGLSESFINLNHNFQYLKYSIYKKIR